jgi:hypothetical protein
MGKGNNSQTELKELLREIGWETPTDEDVRQSALNLVGLFTQLAQIDASTNKQERKDAPDKQSSRHRHRNDR